MVSNSKQYRHNHYVPIWYQKRFMLRGQDKYWRLDLTPEIVDNGRKKYTRKDLHFWSPERVFAQDDLYSVKWGQVTNTEIEQFFFGPLDNFGRPALDYFTNFTFQSGGHDAFRAFISYMSVQKLRTPKGLANLSEIARSKHRNLNLLLLQNIKDIYCAIWSECIWQIADASDSPTKLIISDHPVTVYNRACPPLSRTSRGHRDPDIRMHATHTYFPLSLDKVLILTNLSWARNPYQKETRLRPNPDFFRDALFRFQGIQTGRKLSENEVLQINLITKRRANRYIAAADREWLYPERRLSSCHWRKFGDGYLLMPEPRLLHLGGEIFIGYNDGSSDAFSEYGHRPWQDGYEDRERVELEWKTFYRFQAEWALKHGPKYTAQDYGFGGRSLIEDDERAMKRHRQVAEKYRSRRGKPHTRKHRRQKK